MAQTLEVDASASAVRRLNDEFRHDFSKELVVITPAVAALADHQRALLLDRVRTFDDFNAGNDPWGEHDFGSVELDGETYCWRIDAYDASLEAHSPNAADPAVTRRVLTVMRADEY